MNSLVKSAEFGVPGEPGQAPTPAALRDLAQLLDSFAPHDGRFDLAPDGVHVLKATRPAAEETYTLSLPGICIVPQGRKAVAIAGQAFEYGAADLVVYAAEVPIAMRIVEASAQAPFLCLVIPVHQQLLGELVLKIYPHGVPRSDDTGTVYVGHGNERILQSAIRLVELVRQQDDADLLVPLAIQEMLIRLLRSPAGAAIAQIGVSDSSHQKIARAINWLKAHYAERIRMEELARIAGMSLSAFHARFKQLTSMSPLQFQKTLRLHEARHLIVTRMMDVSTACFEVGYSSVSQFSREYRRLFGVSPGRQRGL